MRRVESETERGEVLNHRIEGVRGQVEHRPATAALRVHMGRVGVAQVVCRGPVPEVDVLDDPQG